MMELHGNDYVYEVTPPFMGGQQTLLNLSRRCLDEAKGDAIKALEVIEATDTTIRVGLKGVSMLDLDKIDAATVAAYNDYAKDKAAEVIQGKQMDLIKSKVAYIKNLVVDGKQIDTFETAYALACCKELVQWIQAAVHSTMILTAAERKNFLPESDSPV
jgi:hypothetical protein